MIIWALLAFAQTVEMIHPCPPGTGKTVLVEKGKVTAPKVIRKIEPEFTGQARQAGIPPSILLISLVVPEVGPACNIQILSPIGFGLDEAAIAAVREWKFKPGMSEGKPVAVKATVETVFRFEGQWVDPDEERRKDYNVALSMLAKADPKLQQQAVAQIEKLSSKKYGPAEAYFGFLLYEGTLVARDYPRAVELIIRANKKNVPYGIYAMGLLLAEGKAMPADPEKGFQLIREASFANVTAAQVWLARKAADKGDIELAKKYLRLCSATIPDCKKDLERLK